MTSFAEGQSGALVRPGGAGRGSKQADVRAHNERLLLSLVRRHGCLPRGVGCVRLDGFVAVAELHPVHERRTLVTTAQRVASGPCG